jgi:CMP-N-acetylneuraminic acid synthetase/spore coat polysaccharide biosynthesis predicted glycosyltransferase SpsG
VSDHVGVLAIIPARAGSKGVRRKNVRHVGGVPLFAHAVRAALDSGVVDRLVISSDSDEIERWAQLHGQEFHRRPPMLADNAATIADVASHLADELDWCGTVAVLQPTSPLRSAVSLHKALARFAESGADSLMSVVRERHLFWYDDSDGVTDPRPLFRERRNRQYARHNVLRETGAIQLIRADVLRARRLMVGDSHALFDLPDDEALDIDTWDDLEAARRRLERGTVVFRLRANRLVGSGHLYHCLQLAEELADQEIRFLLVDCDEFVGRILTERGYRHRPETDLAADLAALRGPGINVVVNDVLDTLETDLLVQRVAGFRVVSIEDLGAGPRLAEWVVNALYPAGPDPLAHVDAGARWAPLRGEFCDLPPKAVRDRPERVLLTFGGTDPAGLSTRFARALVGRVDAVVTVVLGPGIPDVALPDGVVVRRSVASMAAEMSAADVVVTSAGRTVYEAAATGTPVVVVAQNAREATHAHLGFDSGVVFLGLGPLVDDEHVVSVVGRLLGDVSLRRELSGRLRASVDTRGSERIASRLRVMLKGL